MSESNLQGLLHIQGLHGVAALQGSAQGAQAALQAAPGLTDYLFVCLVGWLVGWFVGVVLFIFLRFSIEKQITGLQKEKIRNNW